MNKLNAVEGIRGFACFMVVLSHLCFTFFPVLHSYSEQLAESHQIQAMMYHSPFAFIYSGTSAVNIFFVLSGYILTYVAFKKSTSKKIVGMFVKRYPRLMIPSLVSCLLAYISFKYFSFDKSQLSHWINNFGDFKYSLLGSLNSGSFEAFYYGESSYNLVLWTMQIELFGSFLIFALCLGERKNLNLIIVLLIIFISITFVLLNIMKAKLGLGLIAFIFGYLFYYFGKSVSTGMALIIFLIGLYFAGAHNYSHSYSTIIAYLGLSTYEILNFISGLLIVYAILFNSIFNKIFSNKVLVFMGKVSFSVYLIHLIIISTIGVFLFNQFKIYYIYSISALFASFLTILIIYFLSLYYYKYVDYKGMNFSNKFQKVLMREFS